MKLAFFAFVFLGAIGCSSIADHGWIDYSSKAVIEDYVVGSPYEILLVDGKPVERIQHATFVTRVPFVVVDGGEHILTMRKRNEPTFNPRNEYIGEPFEIRVFLESGAEYRISEDGKSLLEIKRSEPDDADNQ